MKTKKSLKDIGNEHPFGVPENYFENFASEIERKIQPVSQPLFQTIKPWFYIAAVFVGVALLVQPIMYSVKEKHEKQMISEQLDVFVQNGDEASPLLEYLLDL
jgi:hypothetical protein